MKIKREKIKINCLQKQKKWPSHMMRSMKTSESERNYISDELSYEANKMAKIKIINKICGYFCRSLDFYQE